MATFPPLPGPYSPLDAPTATELNNVVTTVGSLSDPPVVEVALAGNASQPSSDLFAQAGWGVIADPYGMALLSATPGTASLIQIPTGWGGRWLIRFHAIISGLTGTASAAAHVSRNAVNVTTSSVASDIKPAVTGGSIDLDAQRDMILNAGDRLFWSTWSSSSAGTLLATNLGGVLTALTCRWVGQH